MLKNDSLLNLHLPHWLHLGGSPFLWAYQQNSQRSNNVGKLDSNEIDFIQLSGLALYSKHFTTRRNALYIAIMIHRQKFVLKIRNLRRLRSFSNLARTQHGFEENFRTVAGTQLFVYKVCNKNNKLLDYKPCKPLKSKKMKIIKIKVQINLNLYHYSTINQPTGIFNRKKKFSTCFNGKRIKKMFAAKLPLPKKRFIYSLSDFSKNLNKMHRMIPTAKLLFFWSNENTKLANYVSDSLNIGKVDKMGKIGIETKEYG